MVQFFDSQCITTRYSIAAALSAARQLLQTHSQGGSTRHVTYTATNQEACSVVRRLAADNLRKPVVWPHPSQCVQCRSHEGGSYGGPMG